MKTVIVMQSDLSSECWMVQAFGKEYCETCEVHNSKECGGKQIRKTGKNSKGIKIPLGKGEGKTNAD